MGPHSLQSGKVLGGLIVSAETRKDSELAR